MKTITQPKSKHRFYLLLLILLCSLHSSALFAQQQIRVMGTVKDTDAPLPGVTVWEKDTNNGTLTDENGKYSLQITPGSIINFSFIGYKTQTHIVSGTTLNITLQPDEAVLDEVVINAGYYSVKDRERTGSIARVTAKDIEFQPVINPLQAIQGRMAGVSITQNTGVPGGGFDIKIRGRNSLRTDGNTPLYILNGVPISSQSSSDVNISFHNFISGNISTLNHINPNDIESIEVLKDADATAIYGSRGANGVILITTKKGSSDKTTFSFQSTTSISTVSKFMDLMNTQEYLKMRRDAFKNDGIVDYPANAYDVNGTWDEARYTDWQKEFIGSKAISQNTQFSISGGSGQTGYLFSASHRKDGTVFPGDFGYKRTNFSLSVNHQSKDKRFSIHGNVRKDNQKNDLMSADFTKEMYLPPNAPKLYDDQGNLNWEDNTFENPLAKLNGIYLSKTEDFNSNINIDYKLKDNVSIGLSAGISNTNMEEFRTIPSTIYNPSRNITSEQSVLHTSQTKRDSWIIEPKIQWNKEFGNSKWNIVAGSTFEERNQQSFSLQAGNFTSDKLIMNVANAGIHLVLFDNEIKYRYSAIFGRLNYTYRDKYIINITGRRDGSSRFGLNNRFANFGAVGAAWLFSREKLFDKSSWLTFGKVRASYGTTGNDLIGDYQYLNTYGISRYKYDGITGLEPLRLYNPDFGWEINKKFETALELELFNSRIAPSVSYYLNRSSNQLVGIPLPYLTGFNSVQANLGATIENTGWEFTLRTINIAKGAVNWSTNANLTLPKNKLIAFPELEKSTYANQYIVGMPTSIVKVYKYSGINKETGLFEVEDINGDGIINIDDRETKVNIGTSMYASISNHISYKNWSLDFMWMFVNQKVYSPDYYSRYPGGFYNLPKKMLNYFSEDNLSAAYQKPTAGSNNEANRAFQNYTSSDAVIIDGSYIRLKSVQLQYSLNPKWLNNKSVSFFLQGYNLFTITKYWGNDPETTGTYLPALKTVSFGVNMNF